MLFGNKQNKVDEKRITKINYCKNIQLCDNHTNAISHHSHLAIDSSYSFFALKQQSYANLYKNHLFINFCYTNNSFHYFLPLLQSCHALSMHQMI